MKRGPGRPRKRPLEVKEAGGDDSGGRGGEPEGQVDIQVYDLAPPEKKSKTLKGESSSSKSSAPAEESSTPVLRRSTRRRHSVKEIKDKEIGPSTVFDTPPATSIKAKPSRRKQGSASRCESKEPAKAKKSKTKEFSLTANLFPKAVPLPLPPPTLQSLPNLVQSNLLRYLDVKSMENLSQTCSHFDQLINGTFLTSIGIPFDTHFLKEISGCTSLDKKPLLRITCSKPREPYKRVGTAEVSEGSLIFPLSDNDSIYHVISEMGTSPATLEYMLQSQLAMLSLDKLRELDLVPEEARDTKATNNARIVDGFLNYDKALLRHLSSSNCLANVTKLDVMVDNRLFVADHLEDFKSLQELGLSIVAKTGMSKYWFVTDYLSKLEDFVEKLPITILKIEIMAEARYKVQKVFRNKSIKKLIIKGPCTFYLHPVMENLKEIEVDIDTKATDSHCCTYFGSRIDDRKQHRLGLCVVNLGATFQHCPKLETFNGLDIKPVFKEKKSEDTTFSKWNFRMKKILFEDYVKNGGNKDMKQWAKTRWFTKRPVVPTEIGRNRVAHHINAFLFHM